MSELAKLDSKPILFIANPLSRSGKAAERIEQARTLMDRYGLNHVFRSTVPDDVATTRMISKAIEEEGFKKVVYLGGDGTFNLVAKGIVGSGRAQETLLGMLPSGTANDQGKAFGISSLAKDMERNVEIIAKGYATHLDIGEITSMSDTGSVERRDLFFDSVGWGLSAAILSFRNRELEIVKKLPVVRDIYRDQMVYVRASVRELALTWFTRDRFLAELWVDGTMTEVDKLTDLVVSNTIIYAGEWLTDINCKPDDGLFEIVTFRGVRDWTSKAIVQHKKNPITEEMLNKIGVSHSPTIRGADIRIRIVTPDKDKRIPAQLDGEELPPANRFEIRVHPQMLNVIVPEGFHWI